MARPQRRGCRRSAPPELRLAYGPRARPLGRAILSLLPPPPPPGAPCPTCHSSVGCLACRRWAHLLRESDPVAYRRLVTRAVCAVAPAGAAPLPPRYTPGNAGHSQAKVSSSSLCLCIPSMFRALGSRFCNRNVIMSTILSKAMIVLKFFTKIDN
ncbi:hypothetical protein PR202_ga03519 [Eleusine coracana subsp. coracana]|uniref:Uncharacterized protein n=1 Tax=Eleusine coracana subsp. coracana TaxID=191504 RepID=A0AAV5BQ21_ELECO|nr:hypothetical protein PR202_ga03519 [Eleusine coracana subsp. coracana]